MMSRMILHTFVICDVLNVTEREKKLRTGLIFALFCFSGFAGTAAN